MKTPKEELKSIIEAASNQLADVQKMLNNDPSNGKLKNDQLLLLEQHKTAFDKIKMLEEQEQHETNTAVKKTDIYQLEEKKQHEADKAAKKTETQPLKFPEQSESDTNLSKFSLRPEVETNRLLLKMTVDTLIHTIEKRLSKNTQHWDIKDLLSPPDGKSYAFWYCKNQAEAYQKIWVEIGTIEYSSFVDDLRAMSDLLTNRNDFISELLPEEDFNTLSNRIKTLKLYQAKLENEVVNLPNSLETMRQLKTMLRRYVQGVVNELKDIAERAALYNEN